MTHWKVKENTFWKFLIACFRTNNKELMNKILKQNKKELEKSTRYDKDL